MELNGKHIDLTSLEFAPCDYRNENVHLEAALYSNGRVLTDEELDQLEDKYTTELHALYVDSIY